MLKFQIMNEVEIIRKYCQFYRENSLINKDRNLIANLVQATYRLFLINNTEFKVLHASTTISKKGNAVILGDDGNNSIGKTFLSLIISSSSKKYVCDEYTLMKGNEIYGNKNIPIFLKDGVIEYLKNNKIMDLTPHNEIGYLFSDEYFEVKDKIKPSFMVIPYLNSKESKFYEIKDAEKEKVLKATVYGHLIKLNHPETDRISVLKDSNSVDRKVEDFLNNYNIPNFDIPIYSVHLTDPKEIIEVIDKIENILNL